MKEIKNLTNSELITELQEACYLLEDTKKNQEIKTENRIQKMIDSIDETCFRLTNEAQHEAH
jgi:hypothetical protein